jgi:hypothetical protein
MKKVFVILITLIMILGTATGVMAATITLESGVNGQAATGLSHWDTANGIMLDLKAGNRWLLGLDCSTLTVKDGLDSQIWNYGFKGGYSFFKNDSARISATLGYFNQNIRNDITVSAASLGLDSQFKLFKDFYLDAEVEWAVAGQNYQYYGVNRTLNSALHYKARVSYLLTPHFGVTLGYYYNEYVPDNVAATSHNALTLGITGKF